MIDDSIQLPKLKRCPRCKKFKTYDNFYAIKTRGGNGLSGWYKYCACHFRSAAPLSPEDKDKKRQYRRQWYESNKDKKNLASRENYESNFVKALLRGAKNRAKKRGLEFNLVESDIIVPDICPVFGIPLIINKGKLGDNSPSLDLIESTKGYTKGNIAVISYKANSCKRNMSLEEAKKLVAYMESHVSKEI